jgi:hypothetical protein
VHHRGVLHFFFPGEVNRLAVAPEFDRLAVAPEFDRLAVAPEFDRWRLHLNLTAWRLYLIEQLPLARVSGVRTCEP